MKVTADAHDPAVAGENGWGIRYVPGALTVIR